MVYVGAGRDRSQYLLLLFFLVSCIRPSSRATARIETGIMIPVHTHRPIRLRSSLVPSIVAIRFRLGERPQNAMIHYPAGRAVSIDQKGRLNVVRSMLRYCHIIPTEHFGFSVPVSDNIRHPFIANDDVLAGKPPGGPPVCSELGTVTYSSSDIRGRSGLRRWLVGGIVGYYCIDEIDFIREK
jgi:hypothetical protein